MSGESDGVVSRGSSPHICPVLVGSASEQFSPERDMQVPLFFYANRCIKLSRAKQQTAQSDAGGRKMFCSASCCEFWGEPLSANYLNKVAVLHFFFFFGKTSLFLCFDWNNSSYKLLGASKNHLRFMSLKNVSTSHFFLLHE